MDASFGGATHDAYIWRECDIKSHMEGLQNETVYLLGMFDMYFTIFFIFLIWIIKQFAIMCIFLNFRRFWLCSQGAYDDTYR